MASLGLSKDCEGSHRRPLKLSNPAVFPEPPGIPPPPNPSHLEVQTAFAHPSVWVSQGLGLDSLSTQFLSWALPSPAGEVSRDLRLGFAGDFGGGPEHLSGGWELREELPQPGRCR